MSTDNHTLDLQIKKCIAMLEVFEWNCQISVFQFVNIDPDCKVLVTIF